MEARITDIAQKNSGRVRLAGLLVFTVCMATRLSCLIFAAETNCWMWMVFICEGLWSYQSFAIQLPRQPGNTTRRLHLAEDGAVPTVDILLPCCGEPLDIILDTIHAACVIDYPESSFRVLVLDDGNSIGLRQAVEELHHTWSNLLYYSRGIKPSEKVFAKAGNLNYALFEIQGRMTEPPDFIVGFDSDFLPAPNFLRATLPHLLEDHNVGLVGTRQDYWNLPPKDPLCQGWSIMWEITLPRMNELGSSIVSGSGFVMRRQLAVQVRGFPTINEVEDITLSLILPAYGKRVLLLEEMLQLGRVPSSLEGYVRQNRRWVTSFSQLIATPWAPSRESIPSASRFQMAGLGIKRLVSPVIESVGCSLIVPALISGQSLAPSLFLRLQFASSLATFGSVWLYEWLKAAGMGFRLTTFAHLQTLWMCADRLCTLIRFHVFKSQAGRSLVTGSIQNSWNNPNKVSTRAAQVKSDLWGSGVGFNVLFVFGALVGLINSVMNFIENKSSSQLHAMTTFLFPPVVLMCYVTISCHIVPILCVIWPPQYPSARAVLSTHPSDVRAVFPSEGVRQHNVRQKLEPLGYRGHLLLIPVYVIVMIIFCFLYL